jgi:hypothetical protein
LDMKYGLTLFLLSALAGSLALPQTTSTTPNPPAPQKSQAVPGKTAPKKTSAAKKAVPKTAASGTSLTAKKTASSKKTVSSKKGKSAKKPTVAAYRQLAPTPERYREIQQALADKGYLKSEPNGVWDSQSADALRQFQTDQKLSPTGKLSSASLIALGLGPKTSAASLNQIPVQPPAPIETPPPGTPAPTPEN